MSDLNFLEGAEKSQVQLDMSDITIPYIKILQKLSPQCDEDNDSFDKTMKPGNMIDSLSNKNYGSKLKVVPVHYEKVWIEWKPNRAGLVAVHEVEPMDINKDDYSKWVRPNGNEIGEYMNYYCLLPGNMEDGIKILSLTSASLKYARSWNTMILNTRLESGNRAPFFSSVWELETKKNKNDQGSWFTIGLESTPAVSRERFIDQEEYTKFISGAVLDIGAMIKKVDYAGAESKQLEAPKVNKELQY